MGVHTNSIGAFLFDDLQGPFGKEQEEQRTFSRPGSDGIAIQRVGIKHSEVTMSSHKFELTFTTARDQLIAYKALCSSGPVQVTRNSVLLGQFVVLGVQEQPPQAVLGTVGAINGNSAEVLHICNWRLIRVSD